jgi:DNA-binding response OmpR family regulator
MAATSNSARVPAGHVLLVEDDSDIAKLLTLHLEDLGCRVAQCRNGCEGLARALDGTPWNLLVLDLNLPGIDGLDICRQVRGTAGYTPIMMLTARASETDRVLGFDSGADDYLVKPFSVVEFSARVKAIMRRVQQLARSAPAQLRTLRCGELCLDLDRREAWGDGHRLELTAKELDLLAFFMQHPSRVFSRSALLDLVWGTTHDAFEHTVNSHINRLRAKVEPDPAKPRYIVTVWGVGYRFEYAQAESVA